MNLTAKTGLGASWGMAFLILENGQRGSGSRKSAVPCVRAGADGLAHETEWHVNGQGRKLRVDGHFGEFWIMGKMDELRRGEALLAFQEQSLFTARE